MTAFWVLDLLCLAGIVAGALLVLRLRNLTGAVMALSLVGTSMSLLFVVLGAPDDAHAEVVVGAIALPVLYLTAIGKCRTVVDDEGQLGETEDRTEDGVRQPSADAPAPSGSAGTGR